MSDAADTSTCPYCGLGFHVGVCPRVESMEYRKDGTIKRVTFHAPPTPPAPLQFHSTFPLGGNITCATCGTTYPLGGWHTCAAVLDTGGNTS